MALAPGGQVFVERYNGTSYFCTPGYSFTNGIQYDATTYRSSGTTFTGHIDGASNSQGGFGLTDHTQGYAWGEATGGSTCPFAEPWHVHDLAAVRLRHWVA